MPGVASEVRKDAQLAREVEFAIPREMTQAQGIDLAGSASLITGVTRDGDRSSMSIRRHNPLVNIAHIQI